MGAAGGTGERVVREPRVPRTPHAASEASCMSGAGCGERATPSPGQDPLRHRPSKTRR